MCGLLTHCELQHIGMYLHSVIFSVTSHICHIEVFNLNAMLEHDVSGPAGLQDFDSRPSDMDAGRTVKTN